MTDERRSRSWMLFRRRQLSALGRRSAETSHQLSRVDPYLDDTYDGAEWVNSGLLGGPGAPGNPPSSFILTFTEPGRYVYSRLVHDHEGQQGLVIVK
jgi:hypothetical protein